ncbi:MAG: hypothetical protein AAB606_03480, partial [Patescibacteria group bacterium]
MPESSPGIEVDIPSLKPYLPRSGVILPRRLWPPGPRFDVVYSQDDDEEDDDEVVSVRVAARPARPARLLSPSVPKKTYEIEGLVSPAEYKFDPNPERGNERVAFVRSLEKLGRNNERDRGDSWDDERQYRAKASVWEVREQFTKGIRAQIIGSGFYAGCIETLGSVVRSGLDTANGYDALDFFLEYLPAFIDTLSASGIAIILRTFVDISYDRNPEFMHGVVDASLNAPALRDVKSLDASTACPILLNCLMLGHENHPIIKKLVKRIQGLI